MSVDNYFTRQYIPEVNSELHTRRRENFKYKIIVFVRLNNLVINRNCFPIYVATRGRFYLFISHVLFVYFLYLLPFSSITISLQEESQHIAKHIQLPVCTTKDEYAVPDYGRAVSVVCQEQRW
jgi:hypothetical protein